MKSKFNFKFFKNRKKYYLLAVIIILIAYSFFYSKRCAERLVEIYQKNESVVVSDRDGSIILIKPNELDYYSEYAENIDGEFKKFLLKKEDKYFYYHPGVNPFSVARALISHYSNDAKITSSTITQQLVKILLSNEFDRGVKNKIKEALFAISLEMHTDKDEILKMYVNSIYFGNRVQGVKGASRLYFGKEPELLSKTEKMQLLASISSPSASNPFTGLNKEKTELLSKKLSIPGVNPEILKLRENEKRKKDYLEYANSKESFELRSLGVNCEKRCELYMDSGLTKSVREILKINLQEFSGRDAFNGAVVVIKIPENELLAVVGSPDPSIDAYGYKINMAARARPIGSTVKPFIYLKGFEDNLRPYTRVDDREYKYIIGSGYAFYPKNYDYEYRGNVSLHYALSNSLNVPTVKVLEYVGLENFYDFLIRDLELSPVQNLENYQLGIALGGLEMDLLSLSYYFSIFPNNGKLSELKVYKNKPNNFTTAANFNQNKKISDARFIQLINKILNDRVTGIEQFGIKSNLNLLQNNYAVKTGTSMEFHDSWTMGYTPDFLVGVWLGNSDNAPMDRISGQAGAGKLWSEVMNLLINSGYNKKTDFDFSLIKEYFNNENIEYGLAGDNYQEYKKLLLDDKNILNPHDNDIFFLEEDTIIPLRSKENSFWYINGELAGEGKEYLFKPDEAGEIKIKAVFNNSSEEIKIIIE
ncbi:MAG: hypothetical protein GWO79_00880 [Actinobacteria bacterium]|nr:hypothetical protein [Actinomycetota bacterium]